MLRSKAWGAAARAWGSLPASLISVARTATSLQDCSDCYTKAVAQQERTLLLATLKDFGTGRVIW